VRRPTSSGAVRCQAAPRHPHHANRRTRAHRSADKAVEDAARGAQVLDRRGDAFALPGDTVEQFGATAGQHQGVVDRAGQDLDDRGSAEPGRQVHPDALDDEDGAVVVAPVPAESISC
jgi:hypothetical protein